MTQSEQEVSSLNYGKGLVVGASDGTRATVTLWADKTTHRLLVDAGTITTSSASVSATGAAVPASADYIGINVGGTLTGLTAGQATMANSLPVVFASNQSALTVDTELPAAAALADATANPTVPAVGGLSLVFNNTTWDRSRSIINATNSTGTGIQAVGVVAQFDDVSPTAITENQFGNVRMSTNRNLYGTIRDAAGNERGVNVTATNQLTVIDTNIPTAAAAADAAANPTAPFIQAANAVYNGSTWDRLREAVNALNSTGTGVGMSAIVAQLDDTSPTAITENQFGNARMSGNRSLFVTTKPDTAKITNGKIISAASTNATNALGNAGIIRFLTASNTNAAARYLKVYNKATSPTVGTDVPVWTFLIPGNSSGTNIPIPATGLYLATGIGFSLNTGVADADTGAVAANEIVVNYEVETVT